MIPRRNDKFVSMLYKSDEMLKCQSTCAWKEMVNISSNQSFINIIDSCISILVKLKC